MPQTLKFLAVVTVNQILVNFKLLPKCINISSTCKVGDVFIFLFTKKPESIVYKSKGVV